MLYKFTYRFSIKKWLRRRTSKITEKKCVICVISLFNYVCFYYTDFKNRMLTHDILKVESYE